MSRKLRTPQPRTPLITHVQCAGRVYRVRDCQWRMRGRNGERLEPPQVKRMLVEEGDGGVFVLGGQRLAGAWSVVKAG